MIILDASAAVTYLLNLQPDAGRIRARVEQPGESLHVPHLFDVEVLHVLRRYSLRGQITPTRALHAVEALVDLRAIRYPHAPFINSIWELRRNLSAYDATHIALAEALHFPVVTLDARLASAPGHRALVEFLG